MRISDLIQLGQRYFTLGIVLVLFVAIAFVIGYFIVYKKILKGQKRLNVVRLLWWAIFLCYLTVVVGVTLMDRSGFWQNGKIMPLFYSYRDAWVDFSATSWRNIILNICMFIPLGFLLPLGFKWFRNFWKTYLVGFALTAMIELTQLLTSRGMFELDDLLNNTVGTMIGYGIFMLFIYIVNCVKKTSREKIPLSHILGTQLPFIITITAFSMIFIAYEQKELGNDKYQYLIKQGSNLIHVTTTETYSEEKETLPVYKLPTLSQEETKQFAAHLFQTLGTDIDESRNDFYEDTAVFWAFDRYSLWIDYVGGNYRLTDFDTTFPDEDAGGQSVNAVTNASEDEIRHALSKYKIEIPKEAEFSRLESGSYQFQVNQLLGDNTLSDGSLTCDYYDNGCFANINYSIFTCEFYKDFATISEQEAYEKICAGEFRYAGSEELNIEVGECNIEYDIDSKGFYQPVYLFSCNINGTESEIGIRAIQ